MGLFDRNKKTGGLMDVIRCDETSYLIWKWHPSGSQTGVNKRENAIRWGSSLRVKDGEVAVFVYNQENGTMQDFIEGPFDQIIETGNLPVLANIVGLLYDGGTPFQAEVYFINLAHMIQVKFGVPYFDVFDPRYTDFSVPIAVRGTISFQIKDYVEFVKLHRLSTFDLDVFQKQIKDTISRYVKDTVANIPATYNIPVIQIERKIAQINEAIEFELSSRLEKDFGVVVSAVDISAVDIDKYSEGYTKLMTITQNPVTETVRAQTTANVKNIHDIQRIEAENYAETLRIQREESQYAQHKATQTANFAAFQVEKQAEVGVAGAEAFGKMSANGAGDVNLGGAGFNPAAMMAGIAMGGAVGQNMAGMMNDMMSGVGQAQNVGVTPPPIPSEMYHVAVNGQATGPFDINTLKQMSKIGRLSADSLVWKPGMTGWVAARDVEGLSSMFIVVPPIPEER